MNLVSHPKDRDQNTLQNFKAFYYRGDFLNLNHCFEMTSDFIISVFITSVNQNLNHDFFFFFFFVILGH
jgi:hypothetical protein